MKKIIFFFAMVAIVLSLKSFGQSAGWAQCGGSAWTGPLNCVSGYTCTYMNASYSQCIPSTGGGPQDCPPGCKNSGCGYTYCEATTTTTGGSVSAETTAPTGYFACCWFDVETIPSTPKAKNYLTTCCPVPVW
jgi:hypothetical protein